MPERFSPAQPNYLRFVSTPTIDIEPLFFIIQRAIGLPVADRRRQVVLPHHLHQVVKPAHDITVAAFAMGQRTVCTVFDAVFCISEFAAALVPQGIERTVAE